MIGIVAPTRYLQKLIMARIALNSLQRLMKQLGYNQGEVMTSRNIGNSMAPVAEA